MTETSYARRVAAGLCGKCGVQPAREGLTLCKGCADAQAELKLNLRRAGLCVSCKAKTLPGVSYCATCRASMSEKALAKAANRLAAGLCIHCGEKRDRDTQICTKCAEVQSLYRKSRRDRLKADGICVQCAKKPAIPERTRCFDCSSKVNDYGKTHADLKAVREHGRRKREEAKKNGICFKCFKAKPKPGQLQCRGCSEKGKIRSKIRRAEARKARLAAAGVVERTREEPGASSETERARRARVKAEKTEERERQDAHLPPAAELKTKMDEHNLSVRDYATLHGIPEARIRAHLASIGVLASSRNGWQVKNDAKRAQMEGACDSAK